MVLTAREVSVVVQSGVYKVSIGIVIFDIRQEGITAQCLISSPLLSSPLLSSHLISSHLSVRHGRALVNSKAYMAARAKRSVHNVEQLAKMIPFVTSECPFGQDVS